MRSSGCEDSGEDENDSGLNANGIPGQDEHPSERSDAGTPIVAEPFVFVKKPALRSAA
jgi:hypothetical protein